MPLTSVVQMYCEGSATAVRWRCESAPEMLSQRVRIARRQPRHRETHAAKPPLEHRQIQLGEVAVVARLKPEAHAIVAEAAAGRTEKVGRRRQPVSERRRNRVGAKAIDRAREFGRSEHLVLGLLVKDAFGGASMWRVTRSEERRG